MRGGSHFDTPVQRRFLPRYIALLNPGIEGIEWFVSSDLAQWDYQLSQKHGIGYFGISASMNPLGVALAIDPLNLPRGSVKMAAGSSVAFDFYIGMEAIEAKKSGDKRVILFNLSGHGNFDMSAYQSYLSGELEDFEYPRHAVEEAMTSLPKIEMMV